ncbi:MBL fold metallo-hydrolase [Streptomyces sp. NPDC055506]
MAAPLSRRQHPPAARPATGPGRRRHRFVGHADETAASARTHAGNVDLIVNTHWHSDHVGGNALLHAQGSAIAADTPEAYAITSRDSDCSAGRRCPTCTLGDLYSVRRSAGAAQGHSWPPSSSSFNSGASGARSVHRRRRRNASSTRWT